MTSIQLPGTQEPQRPYTEPEPPENTPPQEGAQATAPNPPEPTDSNETVSPAATPQEPQEPVQAPKRTSLPPDFDEKMMRLVKARADALEQTRFDDRGRVVKEGIADPDERLLAAGQSLAKFYRYPEFKTALRAYLDGGEMPKDWVPARTPTKSIETWQLERQILANREKNPVLSAAHDYILGPVGEIVPAFAQVFADTYVGLVNFLPGEPMKSPDVKAAMHAAVGGGTTEEARARINALNATSGAGSGALRFAGELGGQLPAYLAGGGAGAAVKGATAVGKGNALLQGAKALALAPGTIMKAGGAVGSRIGAKVGGELAGKAGAAVGKAVGHASGGFAALGGVTDSEDRLTGLGIGAASGAAVGAFSELGKAALRGMFRHAYQALGSDEKQAMDALKKWATDNGVHMRAGDTQDGYVRSLTNAFVDAGMPGVKGIAVKKLLGYAVQGGIDSVGFSTIDYEFWKEHGAAVFSGDAEALKELGAKLTGGALALGAFHIPLKDIPARQRRSQVEPQGEAPGKPELPAREPETPGAGVENSRQEPMGGSAEAGITTTMPPEAQPRTQTPERNRQQVLDKLRGDIQKRLTPLETLGWREVKTDAPPEGQAEVAMDRPMRRQEGAEATEESANLGRLQRVDDAVTAVAGTSERLSDALYRSLNIPSPSTGGNDPLFRIGASRFLGREADLVDTARIEDALWRDRAEELGVDPEAVFGHMSGWTAEKQAAEVRAVKERARSIADDLAQRIEREDGSSAAPRIVELTGTPHSYTVTGDTATANPSLGKLLGIKEPLPVATMEGLLEHVSLLDALKSKTLPGTEIDASGIKAVGTNGTKDGVMRTVRLGEVLESPLQPDAQWKPVENAPQRGKDALEPDQQAVVAALKDTLTQAVDLPQADRAMLSGVVEVLDTVAARNDQSVAETLQALPKLLETLGNAPTPEQASLAIKAAAESLTVKTPEQAIRDMQKAAAPKPEQPQSAGGTETPSLGDRIDAEMTAAAKTPEAWLAKWDIRKKGAWWSAYQQFGDLLKDRPDFADASGTALQATFLRTSTKETEHPEKGVPSFPTGAVGFKTRKELLSALELERTEFLRTEAKAREAKPESRAGEAGFVDPQAAAEAFVRSGDMLIAGAGDPASIGGRAWDFFQRGQIQQVEALGRRDIAQDIGWKGTTATKEYASRISTAGRLMDMRRAPRKQLDSLEELGEPDANGGYADLYLRSMDKGAAGHWGRPTLTEGQVEVVEMGRAVHLESGRIAEELGIKQTDMEGKNPRDFKAGAEVLVREYTPEMQTELLNRSGPRYEAMLRWLEGTYNWSRREAEQRFSDARSLTQLDATEIRRSIPYMPSHLDVPGFGRPVRVLETRPLEHAERLAFRNAHVMGARSVMPRLVEKPAAGAQTHPSEPGLEPLPPTAQQLVDSVLNTPGSTRQQVEAVANMVRAMHGMPLMRERFMPRPGEKGYDTLRFFGALGGLAKSGALTMSFARNLFEPIANIPYFGSEAVGRAFKDTLVDVAEGKFAAEHRKAVEEGWVADTKINTPWKGDRPIETFEAALKKSGEYLTSMLRGTQDFNEMVNVKSGRERLAAMQAGEGVHNDHAALKLLGFNEAEARAMMRGQGTAEQYDRYKRNIVGQLAGGKSKSSAERSAAAHSRQFKALVWFTDFFQARSAAMTQLAKDIGETQGAERAAAMAKFLQFGAMTVASGALGTMFMKLINGWDDMTNYVRETVSQDPVDMVGDLAGLFASGVVGGVGQPLAAVGEAITEPGNMMEKVGNATVRALGPVSKGLDFINFVRALNDQDVPGYENLSALGKTAKYLRDSVPAARAVHEGVFGIGALALTEKDPKLDAALDSYYRWRRDNKPFGDTERPEEAREWRDSMRAVMDQVMAGKKWGDQDLVDALTEAVAAKRAQESPDGKKLKYTEARDAVADSFMQRKMLPDPKHRGWTKKQIEALHSHLGEQNAQILKDWDKTLETMARRVKHANLR